MQTSFQFGDSPPVALSLRDDLAIVPQVEQASAPIGDVESAAVEALQRPLGFPPMTQAVVEGDRVAIALEEGVRGGAEVVRAVVHLLRESKIPPPQVSVVVGSKEESLRLDSRIADLVSEGLQVVVHNPHDNSDLVFVAAVDERPLRLNRALGEADFVIPVACARHDQVFDVRGPFAALFPQFSDAQSIADYQSSRNSSEERDAQQRREEADRVGWLLGVTMVVETIPARGGGVAAVLAGDPRSVARESGAWCEQIWGLRVHQKANLVVSGIGGGAEEQTWENVVRALHAAARVSDDLQTAIVICSELEQEPGPLLRSSAEAQESDGYSGATLRAESKEAAQAHELRQALERGPVYFMGRLPESTVEDMGMAPLASFDELHRLISRSGTCLVINDGQHAVPMLSE